jgi:hypothetical protein
MDELAKDKRFSHIKNDPRFYNMPKNERKVKIDKRFQVFFFFFCWKFINF